MIRILHIVGTMDLGGAETFIMNLYRNIDRTKIQFDFLCHNRIEAKYTDEILSLGGKMYMVEGISHVGFFKYQKNLYEFFKSHPEYKVVHSHQNDLNGLILKQAKLAGVSHRYSHLHTVFASKSLIKILRYKIFRLFFKNNVTDAFACSIPSGKSFYRGNFLKNFKFISNGINSHDFLYKSEIRTDARNAFLAFDGPVIGHVGRFDAVKNHTFILDVFNEFLKFQPSATLVLIGEGELFDEIKNKALKLGIDKNIRFLGARHDVAFLMNGMDVFLFPSILEGLPVTLVEAQASGLSIVASDSISDDSVLTDLITRISLLESPKMWAQKINDVYLNSIERDRSLFSNIIKEKGFDISSVATSLSEKYLGDYYT